MTALKARARPRQSTADVRRRSGWPPLCRHLQNDALVPTQSVDCSLACPAASQYFFNASSYLATSALNSSTVIPSLPVNSGRGWLSRYFLRSSIWQDSWNSREVFARLLVLRGGAAAISGIPL